MHTVKYLGNECIHSGLPLEAKADDCQAGVLMAIKLAVMHEWLISHFKAGKNFVKLINIIFSGGLP